jgi:hypothetical protein
LHEAKDLDRLAAIFLLGCAYQLGQEAKVWADEVVLPLLESPDLLERGACAIPFAWRNERQILPVLSAFLTESLFQDVLSVPAELATCVALCDYWRIHVVKLLGQWRIPSLIPLFCEVWLAVIAVLQHATTPLPPHQRRMNNFLFESIDEIAFALGQVDAFAALDELPISSAEKRLARFHMVCGHLWVHHPEQWRLRPEANYTFLLDDPSWRAEIARLLNEHGESVSLEEEPHLPQQVWHWMKERSGLYEGPPNPKLATLYREDILKLERAMEARRASIPATTSPVQPGETETVDELDDDFSDLDLHDF